MQRQLRDHVRQSVLAELAIDPRSGEIRFIGSFEALESCPLLFVEAAREFYRRP